MTNYVGQLVVPGLQYGRDHWEQKNVDAISIFTPTHETTLHMVVWLYPSEKQFSGSCVPYRGITHNFVDVGAKYASQGIPIAVVPHPNFGPRQFHAMFSYTQLRNVYAILFCVILAIAKYHTLWWLCLFVPYFVIVRITLKRHMGPGLIPISPDQLQEVWDQIKKINKLYPNKKCILVGTGYSADVCAKILCTYDPDFVIRFLGIAGLYHSPESLIDIRDDIDVACLYGIAGESAASKNYLALLSKKPTKSGPLRRNQWELGPAGFGNGNLLSWSADTWFYLKEMARKHKTNGVKNAL